MGQTIHMEPQQVPDVFKRAFPEYTGRKYKACACESVTLSGAYWDGGSRSEYRALNLATGEVHSAHSDVTNPFKCPTSPKVDIPPGCAIVEHSIFCGKDMGITIHVRPENFSPLLPPSEEMTRDQAIVLEYTAALKPSYNGISNFRFHEAHETHKISLAAWDTAKAECISKGYLNKAGAITPAGRNARANNNHGIKRW